MSKIKTTEIPIRAIAFYLPQYHPIPENDAWWGKGFTEWTNVTKAKPYFKGHQQPNLPADLGFYDLRLPEIRTQQASLAQQYGIEGFCYWHYWFGNGKRILERPFNEVLSSGEPNFPFCLAWANESWTGIWHGMQDNVLMKQEYPGEQDFENHFYTVLPAFKDKRYIRIDDEPIFLVYRPHKLPNAISFIKQWQDLAKKEGLKGIFFIAVDENKNCEQYGFNGVVPNSPTPILAKIKRRLIDRLILKVTLVDIKKLYRKIYQLPNLASYEEFVKNSPTEKLPLNQYPVIIPGWDNTPRSGENGLVLTSASPELFEELTEKAVNQIIHKPKEHRLLFIKSWNEWAEGNTMEPTAKDGHGYLTAFKKVLNRFNFVH